MEFINKTIRSWLYVDTRTLALFRIYFGFIGFVDVLRRYTVIDVFYSDVGMNFRRQVSGKYAIKYFTLLEHFNGIVEVRIFFIITALCFFFLMIGYYTRIFQILSAIGLISIHNAAVILENGADMVFNNYLVWTLFLPLGTSLSIDSIRRSFKANPEYDTSDLNTSLNRDSKQIFHIAYIACLVQLAMIYFYNNFNKTGDMWVKDFTALHYMYELDTFLTPVGEIIAALIPIWAIKFLTQMTLWIEFAALFAILSPLFQPWLRRLVLIIFIPFHLIILISVNIGLFSWVMFAVLILLLSKQDIDIIKNQLYKFSKKKYIVFYDRDCGFCYFTARVIKRLDIYSNIKWDDSLAVEKKPEDLKKLLESSIVVWDPKLDRVWTRHIGFSKIISSLPMGFLISWIFKIPLLKTVFGYIYDYIAINRSSISKMMGMPACGIKNEENVSRASIKREFKKTRKLVWGISNLISLSLLVGAVDYSIQANEVYKKLDTKKEKKEKKSYQPSSFKETRRTMKRILLYPRMHQKWNMFSPKVITYEKWVIADLVFENGDSISLFTTNNNIENEFNRKYFEPYNNQFWRKLFGRLGKTSYQKYIPKFKIWLKQTDYFSEYNGRKVSDVKLWKLSERSPKLDFRFNHKIKATKSELKKRTKRNKKTRKTYNSKKQDQQSKLSIIK